MKKLIIGAILMFSRLSLANLDEDISKLAERVMGSITLEDIHALERSESEEQKKKIQPRLLELLKNRDLPKNNSKAQLLDAQKNSYRSKLWNYFTEGQVTDEKSYTYFLKFPEGERHLVRFLMKKNGDEKISFELLGKPVTDELLVDSELNLTEKNVSEYFFLFVALMVPLFMLYVLILCLRLSFERKWIWVFFIILGFVQYDINWATGRIGLRPLAFIIFGSKFSHSPDFGPWIFSTSIPLGAILFLWKKRKILQKSV